MAQYVDGFVIAIPKKHLPAYRTMAKEAETVWRKYGALEYKECLGEDLRPKGVVLTFPKLLTLKPGEVVIFAYILYRSRAHRDRVNAKVMADPLMKKYETMPMPFDMRRFATGGFEVIVG